MSRDHFLLGILVLAFFLLVEAGCYRIGSKGQEAMTISKEACQQVAASFLRSSPTFRFDGIENTLRLVGSLFKKRPYCWQFDYEFRSRHPGYGDRSKQMLAQVITSHRARIVVQEDKVVYAVLDGRWDILKQRFIRR